MSNFWHRNSAALYPTSFTEAADIEQVASDKPGTIRLFGPNWGVGVAGSQIGQLPMGRQSIKLIEIRCATNELDRVGVLRNQTVLAVDCQLGDFATRLNETVQTEYFKRHDEFFPARNQAKPGSQSSSNLLIDVFQNFPGGRRRGALAQLVNGTICIDPFVSSDAKPFRVQNYFRKIRKALGIDLDPTSSDQSVIASEDAKLFLHPHGFSVFGALALPWTDERLEGWFTLTSRDRAVAPVGETQTQEQTQDDEAARPGLYLYTDHPDAANWLPAWYDALAIFSKQAEIRPQPGRRWLSVTTLGQLAPEDLFWPAQRKPSGEPYAKRNEGDPLEIERGILNPRLTPGRKPEQQLASVEFGSLRQQFSRGASDRLTISSNWSPIREKAVHYRWPGKKNPTGTEAGPEEIAFTSPDRETGIGGGAAPHALVLAVPMIETAARLRRESGLPPRDPKSDRYRIGSQDVHDPVGPLWLFSPIDNGLLHFPFPDATAEGFESILPAPDKPSANEEQDLPLMGSLRIANDAGAAGETVPGSASDERPWELSVTNLRRGSFKLKWRLGEKWELESADLAAEAADCELDGAFPVLPFAQSRSELLPGHEIAHLRPTSLRGVTYGQLRQLEARMDKHMKVPSNRGARAELRIAGFRLVGSNEDKIPARLEGRVTLDCTIRTLANWEDGGSAAPLLDETLRPWMWTRFEELPAIQTMPLTTAGAATRKPSSRRELMPLQRAEPSDNLRYVFENALDMRIQSPRLVIAGDLTYAHPLGEKARTVEIGHALLTLPSATVHAQDIPSGDGASRGPLFSPEVGQQPPKQIVWRPGTGAPEQSSPVTVPLAVELRHDLALRDEYHALAAVTPSEPGSGQRSDTDSTREAGFEPRANNAPLGYDADGRLTTPWEREWSQNEKALVLAASDRRTLVEWKAGSVPCIANFIAGKTEAAFSRVELDEGVATKAGVIGALVFVKKDNSGTAPAPRFGGLLGLAQGGAAPPASAATAQGRGPIPDLEGFSDGEEFAHGTLLTSRKEGGSLEDQWGHSSEPRVQTANTELIGQISGGTTLLSTAKPLKFSFQKPLGEGQEDLELWFSDLPEKPEAYPGDAALNGSDQFRHAFRWGLAAEQPEGQIDCGGMLRFKPLRIAKFTASGTKDCLSCLEVEGELGFALPDTPLDPQLSDGLAKLIISGTATGGGLSAVLSIPVGVRLPLKDQLEGVRAVLESVGPSEQNPAGWKLHLDWLGRAMELSPLKADPADPLMLRYSADDLVVDALQVKTATVSLRDGVLALEWQLRASRGDIAVMTTFAHRQIGAKDTPAASAVNISGGGLGLTLSSGATVHLGADTTAVTWISKVAGPTTPFAFLFQPQSTRGAVLVTLGKQDGSKPVFALPGVHIAFQIGLKTAAPASGITDNRMTALFDSKTTDDTALLRLDGQMSLTNAWNDTHSATIRFDGAPLRLSASNTYAALAAQAEHKLQDGPDRTVRCHCLQYVWLTPKGVRFDAMLFAQNDDKAAFAVIPAHSGEQGSLPPKGFIASRFTERNRRVAQIHLAEAGSENGWAERLLQRLDSARADKADPAGSDIGLVRLVTADTTATATGFTTFLEILASPQIEVYGLTRSQSGPLKFNPAENKAYAQLLRALAKRAGAFLVPDPGPLRAAAPLAEQRLLVPSPDSLSVTEVLRRTLSAEPAAARGPEPGRMLANLAPWAECGLLLNADRDEIVVASVAGHTRVRPTSAALRRVDRPRADPRLSTAHGAQGDRVPAYVPQASGARHLTAGQSTETEEGQFDPLLSSHVLLREWQLGPALSGYSGSLEIAIDQLDVVSFRPAQQDPARDAASAVTQSRRQLPDQHGVFAAGFAAAGLLGEAALGRRDFSQAFAPPVLGIAAVAPRAGVMQAGWLSVGIAGADDKRAFAVSPPFHLRAPRPPQIARNDRPRRSEFTTEVAGLAPEPQFVIYGPRRSSPSADQESEILLRAPLARSAWLAKVILPQRGVIAQGWDGVILFDINPHPDAPGDDVKGDWTVRNVTAQVGDRVFRTDKAEKVGTQFRIQTMALKELIVGSAESGQSTFADAALAEIIATRAEVTVELHSEALRLTRHPRFTLLLAGRHPRPVVEPRYLTFEDPEYVDTLRLPAFQAGKDTDSSRMLADRSNLRAHDVLTLMVPDFVKLQSAKPKFEIIVIRAADPPEPPGKMERIALEPPEIGSLTVIDLRSQREQKEDGKSFPFRLRPGDEVRISIRINGEDRGDPLILPVVTAPLVPGSRAAFAVLQKSEGTARTSAPLYALSPDPDMIELVDPEDLLDGIARFRASHCWTVFLRDMDSIALQKIAGGGGMFVSKDLSPDAEKPGRP